MFFVSRNSPLQEVPRNHLITQVLGALPTFLSYGFRKSHSFYKASESKGRFTLGFPHLFGRFPTKIDYPQNSFGFFGLTFYLLAGPESSLVAEEEGDARQKANANRSERKCGGLRSRARSNPFKCISLVEVWRVSTCPVRRQSLLLTFSCEYGPLCSCFSIGIKDWDWPSLHFKQASLPLMRGLYCVTSLYSWYTIIHTFKTAKTRT